MKDEPVCECGHVEDEHGGNRNTTCTIAGCKCIHFDAERRTTERVAVSEPSRAELIARARRLVEGAK